MLTANADRLQGAANLIPQGLAVFDPALRLVAANARYDELLGLPHDLIVTGASLGELALYLARRGDFGPGEADALAAARFAEMSANAILLIRCPSAGGPTLEVHSRRMEDGGLTLSFLDVTAHVAAEAELARVKLSLEQRVDERTADLTRLNAELEIARAKADAANLDKTRFLAAASHDLLQPLNAARLYTSTLVERSGGTAFAELAHGIEASLNAVEEIMSALLDISRLDSGALKQAPAPFAIGDLIRKVEVEFGPLAREKSVTLKLVSSQALAFADRLLLARVVQNLVSNAVKYTRPGGRVLVGVRARGTRLRIDVIDTGIGFSRDQQGLIFAEFSRLDQGARMATGLGLGLSIVQRLVAALGLGLEIDSVEGRGSRFSVYLPRAQGVRPAAPAELVPSPPGAQLAGLNLLCVDNDLAILEAMAGLLRGWGCNVQLARSLRDLSRGRLLEGWLPDLVLMDYHLDQTSGLDAIEWLRQNVGGHLPAALLTADRSPQVRVLAEARGVTVITKPVKPAALRATIAALTGAGAAHPAGGKTGGESSN
ncbi:MAG TPA: ATP-binding protein [Devosiaceae bacterium]|nr:ATP-binding protein [Devosiaceae bacterium]